MAEQSSENHEENGAAKLWAVYVSEAEKYDKSLVESWKSDMEGMLIFAGLFSASLTAFIVESYKTLTPDSGDATVQLLAQISQQLSSAANGTIYTPDGSSAVHTAPRTAIVCNVLWFLSLGLSLTCALVATLLEQWARDFLHRAEMRSSPIVRARIYSYLYYGLKRFQMHTVVDIIPLLLHAALLLFFGGLVAFLLPINHVVAGVAAGILLVVLCIYITLTVLPIWSLDCPYRTPLTNGVWRLMQLGREMVGKHKQMHSMDSSHVHHRATTMSQVVISKATAETSQQRNRDLRALVWTTKSLSDDHELEAFAEAIPDAMWQLHSRNGLYAGYMERIHYDHTLQLYRRIENLLRTSLNSLLSAEASRRRQIICLKAMWALLTIPPPTTPLNNVNDMPIVVAKNPFLRWLPSTVESQPYEVSMRAITGWYQVKQVSCRLPAGAPIPGSNLMHLLHQTFVRPRFPSAAEHYKILAKELEVNISAGNLEMLHLYFHKMCRVASHSTFFDYLHRASLLGNTLPYRWHETLSIIRPMDFQPFLSNIDLEHVEFALNSFMSVHSESLQNEALDWPTVSPVIEELALYWRPAQPRPIPAPILFYMKVPGFAKHILSFLTSRIFEISLWRSIPITLQQFSHLLNPYRLANSDVVAGAWQLAVIGDGPSEADYDTVLQAISSVDAAPTVLSAIVLIKSAVLTAMKRRRHSPPLLLLQKILPVTTLHEGPLEQNRHLSNRIDEARICLLAELLDYCASNPDSPPFQLSGTIRRLGSKLSGKIHSDHQLAFSRALKRLSVSLDNSAFTSTVEDLLACGVFFYYTGEMHSEEVDQGLWMDDTDALNEILNILVGIKDDFPPGEAHHRLNAMMRTIEVQREQSAVINIFD